jgi:hypothetical protein
VDSVVLLSAALHFLQAPTPLAFWAQVAQAFAFLGSDAAAYIPRNTLVVDGSQMALKFGAWGKDTGHSDGQRCIRKA